MNDWEEKQRFCFLGQRLGYCNRKELHSHHGLKICTRGIKLAHKDRRWELTIFLND